MPLHIVPTLDVILAFGVDIGREDVTNPGARSVYMGLNSGCLGRGCARSKAGPD